MSRIEPPTAIVSMSVIFPMSSNFINEHNAKRRDEIKPPNGLRFTRAATAWKTPSLTNQPQSAYGRH
jgi:hypothetical protein